MSLGHGSSIVRDGLIFQFDFANIKSYPGSGTTVTNLNGTGNFTTVGSPAFSNGSLYFNGVNNAQYMFETSSLASHGTGSFTYQVLVKPRAATSADQPTAAGYARIFEHAGFPVTYNILEVRNNNGNPLFSTIGRDINQIHTFGVLSAAGSAILNKWYLLTSMVDRATSKHALYVNTTRYESTFNAAMGPIGNSSQLRFPSTYAEAEMDLSCAMSYSRALSDAEVKQNFEALRGRVGL